MIPIHNRSLEVIINPGFGYAYRDFAIVVNSGSTTTIGYRIYLSPSGEVNYVNGKGSNRFSAKNVN
ncbi:hypothetical protein [uncultured Nostoc sp.]|uniref:hypothetical protein n=1 Tax=uncultured Nostoc sp. TaxID=340711 RepID=UPI0035CAB896